MASNPEFVVSKNLGQSIAQHGNLTLALEPAAPWTAERIAAAEAIPLETAGALVDEDFALFSDRPLRWKEPVRPAGLSQVSVGFTPSGEFETGRVADRSLFPFSAVGKLLMSIGGRDRTGSAWVVGDRAIITAGHCLYRDGSWADEVFFIPQFHRSSEPVGRWAATSIHILAGWKAAGPDAARYDIGAALLGASVAQTTGSIGWGANTAPAQAYLSVGYPRDTLSPQYNFDGQEMWRCAGARIDGTDPVRMANNMTIGCSGGPWLVRRNGKVYATGLNSLRLPGQATRLSSPVFGQGFLNLVAAVT